MPLVTGDRVQFVYVSGSTLPANPDPATIYILNGAQQIYVGSNLVASVTSAGTYNYNNLDNKPQLDGNVLQGNTLLSSLNVPHILFNTTAGWGAQASLQSQSGYLYVYTDHQTLDNVNIPGIKIGDGNAYLIDLPFIDAVYIQHIADSVIHVTQGDRNFWDNKVTCFIDPDKGDKLVFTKQSEEEYNNA